MTAGTTSSLGETRRHSTALLFVFVLAGVLGACMRSEWRKLPLSDGGFSVLMRGEPHYLALQKHLCHQGQSKGSRLHSSIYPPQPS